MMQLEIDGKPIDAGQLADIEKFEVQLARYLSGDLEEDAFRVFRLNNGIYGQRQGGHNQMVRVKVPYGSFSGALETVEWTVLEPDVLSEKLFVRGIGEVKEFDVRGGTELLQLTKVVKP